MGKISMSGAMGGAATGATTGAMFGPMGALVGGGIGGLMGLFSGKDLSKEEKAILKQLEGLSAKQTGYADKLMGESAGAGKKYDSLAKGVRSGPHAQAEQYWSSLLGGDRAKMQSATSPARQQIAETYRGGRRSLDRSNVRGAQKQKAEAEMARQETGQLAGLVQGVQPMAAQELGALETNIQQLMQQYFGLGEQSKSANAYGAASMLGGAADNMRTALGQHSGLRAEQGANDSAMGGAFGKLLGPAAEAIAGGGFFGKGAPVLNNKMGKVAPTPGGFTLPRAQMGAPASGGMNYFNATTTPRNPWGNVKF